MWKHEVFKSLFVDCTFQFYSVKVVSHLKAYIVEEGHVLLFIYSKRYLRSTSWTNHHGNTIKKNNRLCVNWAEAWNSPHISSVKSLRIPHCSGEEKCMCYKCNIVKLEPRVASMGAILVIANTTENQTGVCLQDYHRTVPPNLSFSVLCFRQY